MPTPARSGVLSNESVDSGVESVTTCALGATGESARANINCADCLDIDTASDSRRLTAEGEGAEALWNLGASSLRSEFGDVRRNTASTIALALKFL